jgi:hypothetical protein
MKNAFMMTRMLLAVICLAMVFIVPLPASAEDNDAKVDQGYFKLPDDLEYIKNEVLSGISKTKAELQDEANLKLNGASVKENVLVNRLDDEKILTEDDHELVLIYEVLYTSEEVATRDPITPDYEISSAYYSYNNLVIRCAVRMDYITDGGYYWEGAYPREIIRSIYSFDSGNTYEHYRLGVDSISWAARQSGYPFPEGSWFPLDDSDTITYDPYTFSDTHYEYHYPSNWTWMGDGLIVGYGTVYGDFDISIYNTVPPYDSWYVGQTTRQVSIGGTI